MKAISAVLVLADIRSTHNVGSLFRTADAAGVGHIYLCGVTPTPIDRFRRARADVAKVALGAEKTIPWTHAKSAVVKIGALKKDGYVVIALEQSAQAVDYKKIKITREVKMASQTKIALVLGNEVAGLSKSILKKCDIVAEIPMRGKKESLNVSVAGGIALFRLLGI